MKNQFWAALGSRAVLVKKKFGADYEKLFFFTFSWTRNKFNFFLNILYRIKVKKSEKKIWEAFFTEEKPGFLGLKISM